MEKNQKILDKFGEIIIKDVFDDNYKYFKEVLKGETKWDTGKEYTEIFNKLNENDKEKIQLFFLEMLKTNLFSFLSIFENYEFFKLYFEDENIKINLVEISEMLKSEPIIENGWIERFSKELKNE